MNTLDFNKQLHQARHAAQMKHYPDALKLYSQLAREFPALGHLLEEYGSTAATAGEYELADQCWEKVVALDANNIETLLRLAGEYGKIWLFEKARALSRKAAEVDPNNLPAQVNLASMLSRTAGVAEAREAVDRCLKLDPRNEQARYLAAHLDRRENKLSEAEGQFRDLLASDMRDEKARYFCHFELARVLDKMERHHHAMAELKIAKQLAARTINVDVARKQFEDRCQRALGKAGMLPKNILRTWAQAVPPEARSAAPTLAFLGGHARSGTTLLERIMDAHPSIAACDESLAFMSIGPLIDVTAPQIPADGLNFVRQRYLRNLKKTLGGVADGKILLDKNPPVTAYLPAFLRTFPELRVIIALRDPRDVLVSCYFDDVTTYPYLSFETLAELYSAVMGVWLTVRKWEGLNWMETRYESIVDDLQAEGGKVTSFLGLEWHENQARFHEKNREKTIMSTSNYEGVTSPVHKKSVGRWQAYDQYMKNALPILEPFCRTFGYAV